MDDADDFIIGFNELLNDLAKDGFDISKILDRARVLFMSCDGAEWLHYLNKLEKYIKIDRNAFKRQVKEMIRANQPEDEGEKKLAETLADIADHFLAQYTQIINEKRFFNLRYYRETLYEYDGTRYKAIEKSDFEARVNRYLRCVKEYREFAGTGNVSTIINNIYSVVYLKSEYEAPFWLDHSDEDDAVYIVMQNGILKINRNGPKNVQQAKHTPLYFNFNALSYKYDPNAKCDMWHKFLDEVLPDKDIQKVLMEFFGYCLDSKLNIHNFILLEGEGSNGKGVISDSLISMLGSENVSTVGLERFGGSFDLYPTLGKLANVIADMEFIARVAEGKLKEFVAQDSMQFEKKYMTSFTARPTARLIASTNQLPRFRDRAISVWRRLILIKFEKVIEEGKRDSRLAKKLSVEMSGIFNLALEGLRRLYENEGFTKSDKIKRWVEEYRGEMNPAAMFLKENYRSCLAGGQIGKDDMYKVYVMYCEENNFKPPLDKSNFGKEVFKVFPTVKDSRVRMLEGRKWIYEPLEKNDD